VTPRTAEQRWLGQRGQTLVARIGGREVLLLLAWPWLLFALNPNWVYLNSAGFDNWIYLGHFVNLREYIRLYAETPTYYLSRLSWILPGYAAYHLLPPLAANLALRLLLFYTATLSLYGTLALLVQRRAALLAALLMGSYSYFLLAVGWDYVDGAGITYFALALFLVALAARRPRPLLPLALAGAAAAAMFVANIFTAVLLPALGLAYLLTAPRRQLRDHLLALAAGACGALALLAGLGLVSVALGGRFLFLLSSFDIAALLAGSASNPWHPYDPAWPINYGYLVWPHAIGAAGALALLLPRTRERLGRFGHARALIVVYLVTLAAMLYLQIFRGSTPVLQLVYYASYLIPTVFLALGALLAPALASLGPREFAAAVVATAALAAAPLLVQPMLKTPLPVVPALALAGAWVALMLLTPGRPWHVALLAAVFYLATPNVLANVPAPYQQTAGTLAPQEMFLAILDDNEAIRELAPDLRVRLWFNNQEQPHYIFLSAAHLHTANLLSDTFPALPQVPALGTTVALLSSSEGAFPEAARVLAEHGLEAELIGQRRVVRGPVDDTVTVFRVEPLRRAVSLGAPIVLSANGDPGLVLRDGWGAPEPFGAWTLGPRAELVAAIDPPAGWDVALNLDVVTSVGGFVPEEQRPTITVRVLANDVPVGSWTFDRTNTAGPRQVVIPAAVLARERPLRVALEIDRPHSLQELGYNDDARPLAIAASKLRFELAP
jgi:hypothetical protein